MATEARSLFAQLEAGNTQLKKQWSEIRNATVDSLKNVYERLGINFDYYHGEAMYGDQKVYCALHKNLTFISYQNTCIELELKKLAIKSL